jgi:hypothetical protein
MSRILKRTLPPLLAVLILGLALPASAQRGTQPSPQPGTNAPAELCVPIGLALAVIGDTSIAAEAMGQGATAASIGSRAGTRTLVAYAPAAVGACAELQAFWGDTAGGKAAASLSLYDGQGAMLASDDAGAGKNTGPARHSEPLKALVKLTEVKKYEFVAVLEVKAGGSGANISNRAAAAADGLKVPFTIELRERPQPEPQPQPQTGFITGTVKDAAGNPIEGAGVNVALGANAVTPPGRRPGGGAVLPVAPPISLGAGGSELLADGEQDPSQPRLSTRGAVTGPDGSYRLSAAPGKYLVTASAEGYLMQWFNSAAGAADATLVEVKAGETAADVNFNLQPKPVATVNGIVTNAGGAVVAGAVVMAVKRQPATDPSIAPNTRVSATTRTDAEGKYTLKLDPATYAVGASLPALSSVRQGKTLWWDGKAEIKDADLLELADGTVREGVDFTMP